MKLYKQYEFTDESIIKNGFNLLLPEGVFTHGNLVMKIEDKTFAMEGTWYPRTNEFLGIRTVLEIEIEEEIKKPDEILNIKNWLKYDFTAFNEDDLEIFNNWKRNSNGYNKN